MMKRFGRGLVMLLLAVFILSAAAEGGQYRQLFQKIDYGTDVTYVIGHKSPDPDSISSAIALAELLNALGMQAVPAAAERIDNESAFALQALGLEPPQTWRMPGRNSSSWWTTVLTPTPSIAWPRRGSSAFWITMGWATSRAQR